jgi:hypothetical protein
MSVTVPHFDATEMQIYNLEVSSLSKKIRAPGTTTASQLSLHKKVAWRGLHYTLLVAYSSLPIVPCAPFLQGFIDKSAKVWFTHVRVLQMDKATKAALKIAELQAAAAAAIAVAPQQPAIPSGRSLSHIAFIWCGVVVVVRHFRIAMWVLVLICLSLAQVVLSMQWIQRRRRYAAEYEGTELYEEEGHQGEEDWAEEEQEEDYGQQQYRSFQNPHRTSGRGRAQGELDLGDASLVA